MMGAFAFKWTQDILRIEVILWREQPPVMSEGEWMCLKRTWGGGWCEVFIDIDGIVY